VRVGIVGVGAVGQGMRQLFPDAAVYDAPKGLGSREAINACEVAFVCVPTPRAPDGTCDTSIVEEVVDWLETPVIVIRSTVSVGTTRRLAEKYDKRVVFQPEYGPAETPDHPFHDLRNVRWIILGGERDDCVRAARAWKTVYSSDIRLLYTTPETAELCKYMENAFLATKVTFCNEFFDIAGLFGVDYDELRELWLQDPRIGRSHTFVFPESRGFGGRCLPKDLEELLSAARAQGYEPRLMGAVQEANRSFRSPSTPTHAAVSNNGDGHVLERHDLVHESTVRRLP
jgi:UDPglucose 6-dehydrogenase